MFIPLALAFAGLIAAFSAYRDIRRGGARFYTLEREAILRRANYALGISILFFLGAIGYMVYVQQPTADDETTSETETTPGIVTVTPTQFVDQFPPLPTETATPDLSQPTATPTRPVCRAQVEGTFGNGLTLRDQPNGEQVAILAEGDLVTMLEVDPVENGGFVWRNVRSLFGDEGWVAEQFLTLGAGCN